MQEPKTISLLDSLLEALVNQPELAPKDTRRQREEFWGSEMDGAEPSEGAVVIPFPTRPRPATPDQD